MRLQRSDPTRELTMPSKHSQIRNDLSARSTLLAPGAGYTLIELLSVLTMAGILMAIAIPRIDLGSYTVDAAANSAGSTLLAAQRLAVQRQHPVTVGFDTAGARIRIHDDVDGNGQIDGGEPVRWEPMGVSVRFARYGASAILGDGKPVTFSRTVNGLPSVIFYRNGAASEEGGFYLAPRSAADDPGADGVRAVRIERSTGKPNWYFHDNGVWREGLR